MSRRINGHPKIDAVAFDDSDFPVPGIPTSKSPLGWGSFSLSGKNAVSYKQEINRLENEINRKIERDPKSIHEKSRSNVTRSIRRALKRIHKHIPALKRYLNESTIKTGDLIFYQPIADDKPLWILREEDLPTG